MRRQSLVFCTTPSELQQWLEEELEDRNIDTVYAHTVFSILQQNCIDIDLRECLHLRNMQPKGSEKYEQPSFYSATKCKQQDFEQIKKKAAIDCLRSASDYVSNIEELIDEVLVRLKNIKNLKRETEEITNNVDQKTLFPFFILPSSPTDEIQKYFDAFPSLNEKLTGTKNHTNKNYGVTIDNGSFPFSRKCNKPIIPYSPLKKINAIYQNVESTGSVDEKENCSNASHDEQLTLILYKPITLPFENLHLLQINTVFQCNYIEETLVESKFVILNFEDSSKQENTRTLCNTFISFQKVLSKTLLNCADCKDSVMSLHYKALKAADLQNKIPKMCGEKWLLYWDDKSIAKTWQIDFNYENYQNLDFPVYVPISCPPIYALTKEIKEDGDELLKRLNSISRISEEAVYGSQMPICTKNDIDPYTNLYPCTTSNIDYEDISFTNTCPATFVNDFLKNNQTLSGIKRPTTEMFTSPLSQTFPVYEDSNFETDNVTTDFSAFPNFYETANSIGNYYYEGGGGWSITPENSLSSDSLYTYPYKSSCSLDDLNFINMEYSENMYQNRTQCATESDEHVIRMQNQPPLLKRMKFSYPRPRKRNKPCKFFLQGNCVRTDCTFSHDFATTTCRFWRAGTCLKGDFCPWLHGYPKKIDNDDYQLEPLPRNEDESNSYLLESEVDFPTL